MYERSINVGQYGLWTYQLNVSNFSPSKDINLSNTYVKKIVYKSIFYALTNSTDVISMILQEIYCFAALMSES
jgi:hypothetical protein